MPSLLATELDLRSVAATQTPKLAPVREAVQALPGLTLDEVNAKAALQERVDTKFIVHPSALLGLMEELRGQLEVLDIDGIRSFSYDSIYFDTDNLRTYRDHLQGRRRRFKVRTRHYVDSDFTVLEVKTKGLRSKTEKVRINHHVPGDELGKEGAQFVTEQLKRYRVADGEQVVNQLRPALRTSYRRITLVGKYRPFRMTCDAVLNCADADSGVLTLRDRVLVETKTPSMRDPLIGQMYRLGIRPVGMSKYCAGIGMLKEDIPSMKWNKVIRNHLRVSA
ncbi:MAG: polyphosphate polymerase domain-containing protein [Actinomycetaceae bacterium]|nr:polyphosphate polymerase domain-containing protein [Actinomycetaceae bacterium]